VLYSIADAALKQFPSTAVNKAIAVLVDQLTATKEIRDVNAKCMIEIPDEKIRQDAALAILAYEWGRPTERKISLHADASDFPAMLEALRKSPTFQAIESSQKEVKGKEIPPELPEP
jgi:hypothetical protein